MDIEKDSTFEEFKTLSDFILTHTNYSKQALAEKLGIDATYFSKFYNKAPSLKLRSVPSHILKTLVNIWNEVKNIQSPEKNAVQEELPITLNKVMESFHGLKAVLDAVREDLWKQGRTVALLEEELKRTKIDSEKKISGLGEEIEDLKDRIEGETVKVTVEQPRRNIPRHREAANDR